MEGTARHSVVFFNYFLSLQARATSRPRCKDPGHVTAAPENADRCLLGGMVMLDSGDAWQYGVAGYCR